MIEKFTVAHIVTMFSRWLHVTADSCYGTFPETISGVIGIIGIVISSIISISISISIIISSSSSSISSSISIISIISISSSISSSSVIIT